MKAELCANCIQHGTERDKAVAEKLLAEGRLQDALSDLSALSQRHEALEAANSALRARHEEIVSVVADIAKAYSADKQRYAKAEAENVQSHGVESELAEELVNVERLRQTLAAVRVRLANAQNERDSAIEEAKRSAGLLLDAEMSLAASSVCELAAGNPNVASYAAHWEGRGAKAEAMERAIADILTDVIGEQDMAVVDGVKMLAERFAKAEADFALQRETSTTLLDQNARLMMKVERHAEAVEATWTEAWRGAIQSVSRGSSPDVRTAWYNSEACKGVEAACVGE